MDTDTVKIPINKVKRTSAKKIKDILECAVCGGTATGYNFGRISCESCKAFFRRNASKNHNRSQCRFGGKCDINLNNRRHCGFCRIQKCFAVGMRNNFPVTLKRKSIKKNQAQMIISRATPDCFKPSINVLSANDRMRINNVLHCFSRYANPPNTEKSFTVEKQNPLGLVDYFNNERPIIINLIAYFKHLPELSRLHLDDQVLLVKQNLRFLLPIHHALLNESTILFDEKTKIIDLYLSENYRSLSMLFSEYVAMDSRMMKIFLIVLFFDANTRTIAIDSVKYFDSPMIKQIQSSYVELLWLYLLEKRGEIQAVHLLNRLINSYLHSQTSINEIDSIIRGSDEICQLDSLMKIVFQLS